MNNWVSPENSDDEFDYFAYVLMDNFPQYRYEDIAELSYYRINSMLNYIVNRNKAFNQQTQNTNKVSCTSLNDAIQKAREMQGKR